jgi:hypothetical protein
MNYVWDLVINAGQGGMQKKNIKFILAQSYSPYMELSNEIINFTKPEHEIEINPYYRYFEIFKDMFNINNIEDTELRNNLLDIAVHFLCDIDVMQGMSKREYYIRFILDDMEKGILGSSINDKLHMFDSEEKRLLADNILRLYITGEALYLLKDTVRKIFKNSTIYANYETKDELLFFIDTERTDEKEIKLTLIKDIFLPIKFRTEIYWRDHFGVIGVEETMKIDSIALY